MRQRAGLFSVIGIRPFVKGAMKRRFKIGDRVRVRASSFVPTGTLGRVHMQVVSAVEMYFVQFDGESSPTLIRESDLELVTDAPANEDAS